MPEMDFWRQLDIIPPEDLENLQVTVIGAGGIGSPTALAISKMGVEHITVYDADKVEPHNLPNQMYRIDDVGKSKVAGTRDICWDFAGVTIDAIPEMFKDQIVSGIVISGVDTMKSRDDIWKRIKHNSDVRIYIDARMGAEVCRICTIDPNNNTDVNWYENTLYSDDEASEEPCTARSVIYNTFMIASLVANQVKKSARAQLLAREIIFDLETLTLMVGTGGTDRAETER